jgi:hypothetical protein
MGCDKAKKFFHGTRKQLKGRQQHYRDLALRVRARVTVNKAIEGDLYELYNSCGEKFAEIAFKDTSMQQLINLADNIEAHSTGLGTNALQIFRDGVLKDATDIEMFLENADQAGKQGITGIEKLFQSINGPNNVQGVDYTFRVAVRYGGSDFAKVESFESTISTTGAYRAVDLKFTENIPVPNGNGTMRIAELKSGSAMDLNVKQGIKGLAELEAMGLEDQPTLFRYIHNSDPGQPGVDLPKQAQNFLEQIHTTAHDASAPKGSKACGKVLKELEAQGWLSGWQPTDSLSAFVGKGKTALKRTARQQQVDQAVAWMQKWFYVQYNVTYP